MAFWVYMTACNLITPGLMIGAGYWMWKHPPKEINSWIGYRTKRSMKNQNTWAFAHAHCGKIWWKWGWMLFAVSIAVMACFRTAEKGTTALAGVILLMIQMAVLLISIVPTEVALGRNFDQDGNKIA